MSLETRDRVGFATVPVAIAALAGQLYAGVGTDDRAGWVLIISGMALSLAPFLSILPASWRGELSEGMIRKVPWTMAVAVTLSAFIAVPLGYVDSVYPRIGFMAAAAGSVNLLCFRFMVGRGSLAAPGYWTRISLVTGACVGSGIGLVSVAPEDLIANAAGFALYVAANHWVVRSILDRAAKLAV